MQNNAARVDKLHAIPIYIQWSWLLIVLLHYLLMTKMDMPLWGDMYVITTDLTLMSPLTRILKFYQHVEINITFVWIIFSEHRTQVTDFVSSQIFKIIQWKFKTIYNYFQLHHSAVTTK